MANNEKIKFDDVEKGVDIYALNAVLHEIMKDSPLKFKGKDGEILESHSFEEFDRLMSDKTTTFIL